MVGLPATGELRYNDFLFDGASHITVEVEYLYDEADRTVTGQQHTITVEAVIANDGTAGDLDVDMENIRRRLGQAGRALYFRQKGFGNDLIVNVGTVRDIKNGPKPRILLWLPIGDDKACQITWQVVTVVPICEGGGRRFEGVSALNYSVSYDINKLGDTTRTLAGYIAVAQVGGATADRARDAFAPLPIEGFEREQSWVGNFDKSRVDFTIVDRQIPSPNPYPARMTAVSGRHRVSWGRGRNGAKFFNNISMALSPEAGLSGSEAWLIFLTVVTNRINWAKRRNQKVFIDSLDVEEDLFGRPQSFQIRYRVLGCIRDFVGDMGLWQPIGTDWRVWVQSLTGSVFNNRGSAGLVDIGADDAVVSLCGPNPVVSPNNLIRPPRLSSYKTARIVNEKPSAEQSWLQYDSHICTYRRRPVTRQSILQVSDLDEGGWELDSGRPPSNPANYGSGSENIDDVIQTGGSSRYGTIISGRAMRAGHKIPRPTLVTAGGREATERSGFFMQRVVGNFFGLAVYQALWWIDYYLGGAPGAVQPPDDHKEWVDAQANVASV